MVLLYFVAAYNVCHVADYFWISHLRSQNNMLQLAIV